ncbi:MAG TPA: site-specific integrase [Rhizomicrobium sp.]
MPKIKLTLTAVKSAQAEKRVYELRDIEVPGFLVKVTPTGRKIFMVAYVASNGVRRKPALGRFGELTVEQARELAKDWLADVRKGKDPSASRNAERQSPTMREFFARFMTEYSEARNKPSTIRNNRGIARTHILPALGDMKVLEVTRTDVVTLMTKRAVRPTSANHLLCLLRKMFNMAELWELRPDGSNPCRHVQKYPQKGSTRLIVDSELKRLYEYLDRADAEGLEHPFLTLAIRLQFEFAARMSEITNLEWSWIDFKDRRVVWPDSKTGNISKPISTEAFRLLENAPRSKGSPYVCPSIFDPMQSMSKHTYALGWARVLERAGVPHIGTHGIRHRAATDIANSGIPINVGMKLTAHKTVTMFMRYVHTEDEPVRAAAETIANRRLRLTSASIDHHSPGEPPIRLSATTSAVPEAKVSSCAASRSAVGSYRPFRHRKGENRNLPPGSKRLLPEVDDAS